ncbi:MAG: sugar isomerase domain-containing protein [Erysipelotrichaceae bacterium]
MRYEMIVRTIIEKIFDTQIQNIEKAVKLGLESKQNQKKFYILGTGHSHMMVEEFYDRLAGLDLFDSILMPELMLHQFPGKSTMIERLEGYAHIILAMYPIEKGDTLMLVSNSGRNGMMVEMAIQAKKLGANIITLTNFEQAKVVKSRHISNTNIIDYGDVNIDNCGVYGDACYTTKNGFKIGSTSSITTLLIAQLMNAMAYNSLGVSEDQESLISRFKAYYFNSFNRVSLENTLDASQLLFETFINDQDIYIVGTGHSHLLTEEAYTRAGGFANIKAILEDEIMNHQGKGKSNEIESLSEYSQLILKKYGIKENDTIIICSNSGSGAFSNELAKRCQAMNVKVIAITNLRQNSTSKHQEGLLLKNTATIAIDNCCDENDANFIVENKKCCPLSSSIGCYVLQGLLVNFANVLEENDVVAPILTSANVDMSDPSYQNHMNHNEIIKQKYKDKYIFQHKLS